MGGEGGDLISGIFEAAPEDLSLSIFVRRQHKVLCPLKPARPEEKDEGRQLVRSGTPGRSFRSETPGRSVRSETPGRSVRSETPGRSFRSETPGRSVRSETPGRSVRSETLE